MCGYMNIYTARIAIRMDITTFKVCRNLKVCTRNKREKFISEYIIYRTKKKKALSFSEFRLLIRRLSFGNHFIPSALFNMFQQDLCTIL